MEQACDALRKEIVNAMRAGQVICIDFGKLFARVAHIGKHMQTSPLHNSKGWEKVHPCTVVHISTVCRKTVEKLKFVTYLGRLYDDD